jgi:hypothetical protein
MRAILVTAAVVIGFGIGAAHASASPSSSSSCVATITSFEAHLGPGFVGAEVSALAPVGAIASQLAHTHLGSLAACRAAEG